VRWEDVSGYECGNCHGHFLPAPALHAFFESHALTHRFERLVQNARAAPDSPRNLSCTHCDASSFRTLRAGVVELDACAGCGSVYFDAREAERYFAQAKFKPTGDQTMDKGMTYLERTRAVVDLLSLRLWH
jgi:Zn-finger nucleic acid-binding protein